MRAGIQTGRPIDDATESFQSPSKAAFRPLSVDELAEYFPQLLIECLIGHGGMGAVYLARQISLDRPVALKVIRPESTGIESFAQRFTREAKTLARLNHPHIVSIFDFGAVDANDGSLSEENVPDASSARLVYFLLMEYVDGTTLRQLIAAKTLSPREALAIVPQICDALQFAHDQGVVHRDIKPENILIDRHGRVKIADFGLAKLMNADMANDSLTGTHQVMGTPKYMAPEQFDRSATIDHRADLYSLGVVFYEMLTGELPMGIFDPPSRKVQVDVRLDEVVLRSLAKEPERRYQSASQLKTDVDAVTHDVSSSTVSACVVHDDDVVMSRRTTARKKSSRRQRTKPSSRVALFLMMVVSLLLGAWFVWSLWTGPGAAPFFRVLPSFTTVFGPERIRFDENPIDVVLDNENNATFTLYVEGGTRIALPIRVQMSEADQAKIICQTLEGQPADLLSVPVRDGRAIFDLKFIARQTSNSDEDFATVELSVDQMPEKKRSVRISLPRPIRSGCLQNNSIG